MMMIPKWGNYPGDGGGGITLVIDVGDHEKVRDFERAPGWGQGSVDGESWRQSVAKAAIFLSR